MTHPPSSVSNITRRRPARRALLFIKYYLPHIIYISPEIK